MRYIKPASCVFVTMLFLSPPGWALDCAKAEKQSELNQCAAQDYQKADTQLNKVYSEYRTKLSEPQRTDLRNAQLAWIKFRDLSCKFEASAAAGGSAQPMVKLMCLAKKTQERTKEITALGTCEEGDVSCAR